jgi:ribosomal protein L29
VSKLSESRRHIAALGMAEAQAELKAKRRTLFELRLQLARGEVRNNRQFAQIKADVARLMFRLGEINREALEAPEDEFEAEPEPEAEPAAEPQAAAPAAPRRARAPRPAPEPEPTAEPAAQAGPEPTAQAEAEAEEEPSE